MRAAQDSDDCCGPEKPGPSEWAGLPMEYWIDLGIIEESPVFEILTDLCEKFPGRSRQQHIDLIAARLTERARKDEIAFYRVKGEIHTDLTIPDALAQLHLTETWNVNWDEHLVVWQKPRTIVRLARRFLKLWSRFAGKRGN